MDNNANIEAERAAFEKSGITGMLDRSTEPGYTHEYADPFTRFAWRGWQERARRTPVADGKNVSDIPLDLPELNELPRPAVTYADHSYPAFSKKQMADYAEQYAREAISHYLRKQAGQVAK